MAATMESRDQQKIEELLAQARQKSIDAACKEATEDMIVRWNKLEPLFRAYLGGYSLAEMIEKGLISGDRRTKFYQDLREFGLPVMGTRFAYSTRTKNLLRRAELDAQTRSCSCVTCMYLRGRKDKMEKGLV